MWCTYESRCDLNGDGSAELCRVVRRRHHFDREDLCEVRLPGGIDLCRRQPTSMYTCIVLFTCRACVCVRVYARARAWWSYAKRPTHLHSERVELVEGERVARANGVQVCVKPVSVLLRGLWRYSRSMALSVRGHGNTTFTRYFVYLSIEVCNRLAIDELVRQRPKVDA